MRIAFISDIHGNAVALEAVLKDIASKGVDRIIVLGDISFRGPEPKRALDLIRGLGTDVVKGNADEWLVRGIRESEVPETVIGGMRLEQQWAREKLTEDDLNYLKNLPTELEVQLTDDVKIHAFHATPDSLFEAIRPGDGDDVLVEKLMTHDAADIYLYAHIHLPYVRFINGKSIANLGSVGLPFDGLNFASYLIVDGEGENYSISIERVKYDVEKVVAQLQELDYPNVERVVGMIRRGAL